MHQITKDEVLARWAEGPRWSRHCDENAFIAHYVEPVEAFGLTVRLDLHPGAEAWSAAVRDLPAPLDVSVDKILYSTQVEGVLVSVLAEVVINGTGEAPVDPDGWFGNEHPVLFAWPDGTYTVRDGNHRCIGARLRGEATIKAYVVEHDHK